MRLVATKQPSVLVRATRFLHREYRPEVFYWEVVELLRRTILTGWVLLVPEERAYLRLVVASLVSLASYDSLGAACIHKGNDMSVLCPAFASQTEAAGSSLGSACRTQLSRPVTRPPRSEPRGKRGNGVRGTPGSMVGGRRRGLEVVGDQGRGKKSLA